MWIEGAAQLAMHSAVAAIILFTLPRNGRQNAVHALPLRRSAPVTSYSDRLPLGPATTASRTCTRREE